MMVPQARLVPWPLSNIAKETVHYESEINAQSDKINTYPFCNFPFIVLNFFDRV